MNTGIGATRSTRIISVLALSAAFGLPGLAQEDPANRGGVLLTFGIEQSLSLIENQNLAPTSRGTTFRSDTDLTFGISSETAASRLAAEVTSSLTGLSRPSNDREFDVDVGEPRLRLNYTYRTVDTRLTTRLGYSYQDVSRNATILDLFNQEEGTIDLSSGSLEDLLIGLSGSGDRQTLTYGASLEIRRDRPFGLTVSADVRDVAYFDVTTPLLIDSTRTTLGVLGRFDITPVTQATLGYTYQRLEGSGTSETNALDANLTFTRPDGTLGLGLTATDTRAGTRTELRFSRNYVLPGNVTLGGSLGLTSPAGGDDVYVTAALSYARPLPNGSINAQLNRSFGIGALGQEQVQTSLTVGTQYDLTPLATLSVDGSYARVDDTGTDVFSAIATLGATVTYDLTQDWQMAAGYTFETSDSDTSSAANRNTLSVMISRDFEFRP